MILFTLSAYKKAIAAAVFGAIAFVGNLILDDGSLSADDVALGVNAVLQAFTVWYVRNRPQLEPISFRQGESSASNDAQIHGTAASSVKPTTRRRKRGQGKKKNQG